MTKNNNDKTPDEFRDSLLAAALNHVAFDGWSKATIITAANEVGIDIGMVALAFPDGHIGMINLHAQNCDQVMLDRTKKIKLNSLKIREKITALVKLRIESELPHKEVAHRTISFLAMPNNHFSSLKIMYRTVDLMWKTISDPSTDFNYYTKRMTLAAVYSSTFLYWLNDTSEENIETWNFLDRRIENVMQIEKIKAKCRDTNINLPDIWRKMGKMRYGS